MRALGSVRERELVSSGSGSGARTAYTLMAPERMRLRTEGGVERVVVGWRQWLRVRNSDWQASSYGSGVRFRTRSWFAWTDFATDARLLGVRRAGRRRVAELALFDASAPVWIRLRVQVASRRVLRELMTAPGHFMTARYFGFNAPVRIAIPTGASRGR